LEHLLRNAVDHGLEEASLRVAAGKPAAGRIRVRTRTEGAQLVVEVADDGGGINTARLRFKAVESGFLSLEDVLELSDAETLNLAFTAGLSTAPRVSEISGRGMGLAIVKEAVNRLGGRKVVESTVGEGTTFRLILPIRAGGSAAVRILEASTASGHYAIPAEAVVRVLRLAPEQFDWVEGQFVLALGDERIPLLYLDEVLGWQYEAAEPGAHSQVLLVESGGRRVAWIVDQIGGMPEVTIRRLDGVMNVVGPLPGISGAVFAGDSVMLMLDVTSLVAAAAPVPAASRFTHLEEPYLASKAS
jgi:two-component system chemotaxis sensor kinase CheA